MKIAKTIKEFRVIRRELSGKVGFVPTLGAMHHGHEELLKSARANSDDVCVSIFLNPSQFGPNEDLDSYPTNLDGDLKLCEKHGVAAVFLPSVEEMYPKHLRLHDTYTATRVDVAQLPNNLCGQHRPGHFDGVATVVTKLFNIIQPDVAVFGQKDLQQLAIIRRFVADLNIPVDILPHPTVREGDGLAVSSRNLRLKADERVKANQLYKGLSAGWRAFNDGVRDVGELEGIVREVIAQVPDFTVDYVSCVSADTLQPPTSPISNDTNPAIAVAAHIGSVRLIDNLFLLQPLPIPCHEM